MRKGLSILACLCAVLLCACTTNIVQSDAQSSANQGVPVADGEVIKAEKFTITAGDGWNKMGIPGGVQLYKGSLILQISVTGMNVTPEEDLASLQSLVDENGGTEIEEVQMSGLTFCHTNYTAGGTDQVFYSTVKDGEQIHIQISGNGFQDDADITAMLDSLGLK